MSQNRQQKMKQVLKNEQYRLHLMLGIIQEKSDTKDIINIIKDIIRRSLKDIEKHL